MREREREGNDGEEGQNLSNQGQHLVRIQVGAGHEPKGVSAGISLQVIPQWLFESVKKKNY